MSNNIDPELQKIRNGLYGEDIRTAIHDALGKLWVLAESKEPEPGGDRVSVYDKLYGSQVTDSAITGIADLHPKFTCDTGYYFDYEVSCTLSGRQYTKKDSLPAIGMIIYTIGYSTPLFISPFESAVAYSSYYDGKAIYSVTYDGLTWYYCDTPCAMGGRYDDSEGHLLTYSGTVNYDSTNNRVTPESVLEILQAVHAQSEED